MDIRNILKHTSAKAGTVYKTTYIEDKKWLDINFGKYIIEYRPSKSIKIKFKLRRDDCLTWLFSEYPFIFLLAHHNMLYRFLSGLSNMWPVFQSQNKSY